MEGRGEHAEVEATLELVLLCLLASTVREASGFSEAALAKFQVSILWLRGPPEAACDISLLHVTSRILLPVGAAAAGSCSKQRCDEMVLYPWAGAEALSHGASTRGGRFLTGAEAAAPRLASSIMFWKLFQHFTITDCSS